LPFAYRIKKILGKNLYDIILHYWNVIFYQIVYRLKIRH
jgi:hypothetical protein